MQKSQRVKKIVLVMLLLVIVMDTAANEVNLFEEKRGVQSDKTSAKGIGLPVKEKKVPHSGKNPIRLIGISRLSESYNLTFLVKGRLEKLRWKNKDDNSEINGYKLKDVDGRRVIFEVTDKNPVCSDAPKQGINCIDDKTLAISLTSRKYQKPDIKNTATNKNRLNSKVAQKKKPEIKKTQPVTNPFTQLLQKKQ